MSMPHLPTLMWVLIIVVVFFIVYHMATRR